MWCHQPCVSSGDPHSRRAAHTGWPFAVCIRYLQLPLTSTLDRCERRSHCSGRRSAGGGQTTGSHRLRALAQCNSFGTLLLLSALLANSLAFLLPIMVLLGFYSNFILHWTFSDHIRHFSDQKLKSNQIKSFHFKLDTLPNEPNAFEISLNILPVKTSVFQIM